MKTKTQGFAIRRLVQGLLASTLVLTGSATLAQTPTPGKGPRAGGYVSTEKDMVARPARADVAPVYRGSTEDTLATIRQRGTIRIGVVPDAPMVIVDAKGELSGYSVDLARRLATDLGVDVEFVQTSWPQVVPDLIGRQFDVVISGLWVTMPRALVVNFTQPTASEGIHLVASQKLAAGLQRVGDFNKPEVRIAVDADTVQAQVAKRVFPKATLVTDVADPLEAVRTGKAHATLLPTIAPSLVAEKGAGQLRLPLDKPLSTTSAAMAIRKGDADFLNLLNTWLSMQRDEGWLDDRASFWSNQTDAAK
jgi:polar amino acid transport system substrate-binding protein